MICPGTRCETIGRHRRGRRGPCRPRSAGPRPTPIPAKCWNRFLEAKTRAEGELRRFLFGLTDAELAEIDPDDTGLLVTVPAFLGIGKSISVGGVWFLRAEQARRAALTGHQRIAEARERAARKAVA